MAMRYLGPRFDIHTGGIDNVFPHHEDEIAQTAAITGDVPARHWVHGEFLLMDGRKMAKSAGNFMRVTELAERGIDPLAFRYLTLTSRYSRKLEFSDRSVAAAAAALWSLRAGVLALGPAPRTGVGAPHPCARAPRAPAGWRCEGSPATARIPPERSRHRSRDVAWCAAVRHRARLPRPLRQRHRRRPRQRRWPLREILPRRSRRRGRWLILDADAVLGLDLDRLKRRRS